MGMGPKCVRSDAARAWSLPLEKSAAFVLFCLFPFAAMLVILQVVRLPLERRLSHGFGRSCDTSNHTYFDFKYNKYSEENSESSIKSLKKRQTTFWGFNQMPCGLWMNFSRRLVVEFRSVSSLLKRSSP